MSLLSFLGLVLAWVVVALGIGWSIVWTACNAAKWSIWPDALSFDSRVWLVVLIQATTTAYLTNRLLMVSSSLSRKK